MGISNSQYDKLVNKLNSYLGRLASRRPVTSDDAHNFLTMNGIRELQVRTRLSFINSALMSGNFKRVGGKRGMIPSKRPAARGRRISQWTLA